MDEFGDKVVVITGGATGIGLSFARQFGKEGARLGTVKIVPFQLVARAMAGSPHSGKCR